MNTPYHFFPPPALNLSGKHASENYKVCMDIRRQIIFRKINAGKLENELLQQSCKNYIGQMYEKLETPLDASRPFFLSIKCRKILCFAPSSNSHEFFIAPADISPRPLLRL